MWLTDLLPGTSEVCPTCPTCKNKVGQPQSLVAVTPSDLSDLSDLKKEMESLSGENPQKEEGITQVLYDNPPSVRLLPESVTPERQSDNQKKHEVGRAYSDNDLSTDEPSAAELDHARHQLVACPVQKRRLHCWYCSRCSEAVRCTAWRPRRQDVEFYRQSEKPSSLYLVESGKVGVLQ